MRPRHNRQYRISVAGTIPVRAHIAPNVTRPGGHGPGRPGSPPEGTDGHSRPRQGVISVRLDLSLLGLLVAGTRGRPSRWCRFPCAVCRLSR
jgi:hypothetical protein